MIYDTISLDQMIREVIQKKWAFGGEADRLGF